MQRGRFLALKKASLHIEETPSSNGEVYLYVFSFLLVTNESILSFYLKTRHKVGTDALVCPPKHNQEEAPPKPLQRRGCSLTGCYRKCKSGQTRASIPTLRSYIQQNKQPVYLSTRLLVNSTNHYFASKQTLSKRISSCF